MAQSRKQILLFCVFVLAYGVLFYLLFTLQLRHDFPSFYTAAIACFKGLNPYDVLVADFLPVPGKIPANLNPPFFLQIIQPFTLMSYPHALEIWSVLLFCAGLVGAFLTFTIVFSKEYVQKNRLILLLAYLALYSTVMDTIIAQLGALLLLFIMAGYYFYNNGRDTLAGFFWGIIIAIKLFPALLFFLALSHKRYKVIATMIITFAVAWLLPLLSQGTSVYADYFEMLPRILWYGDSWNASIYGFLFRTFMDISDRNQSLLLIKSVYGVFFMLTLLWYLRTIYSTKNEAGNHRAFCLTLVVMLLMSPFGWMYYFSLLIMPLIITWQNLDAKKPVFNQHTILWLGCFLLINFPLSYVPVKEMSNLFYKISIYSMHFYGVLILAWLLTQSLKQTEQKLARTNEQNGYLYTPIVNILAFGFLIPIISFLVYLIGGNS